jgi:predicted RND superfamily exporter protein
METRTTHRISLMVTLILLLVFSSCKVKYLELESKYQKARQKKAEMEQENRALKTEIALLADSLTIVKASIEDQVTLHAQTMEMESLKKEFLQKKVPYYLQMKKRQTSSTKTKKK